MGRFLKYLFTMVCILVNFVSTGAQPFSYIYIQGDKNTPFYVKMEGQMMPRYGKNYCILSELNPGLIHIEILFQQNVLPAQKFAIRVPEHGYRGFLLNKQEHGFGLYDLQKKTYLDSEEELKSKNEN